MLSRTYSQFTLFFRDFLVLKLDFSVTVQYPCKLFTFSLLNSYVPIFTHKVQWLNFKHDHHLFLLLQNLNTNLVIASWLGHQRLRHHGDAMDIWWGFIWAVYIRNIILLMFNHTLRIYFNKKYSTKRINFKLNTFSKWQAYTCSGNWNLNLRWKSCSRHRQMSLVVKQLF